jgi:heat shock protein HslJ
VFPSPLDSADPAEPLVRRDWSLQGVATDGQMAPVAGTLAGTLRIDGQIAGGKVDCRGYTSHVTIDGASIMLRDLGSTSNACPGADASRESGYLRDLGSVTAWSVADGMLTLSDPAGIPLLAYVPTSPADLSGIWAVGVVVDADGRQVAMPVPMSMWFGGGRITTTVGCAGVEARYAQDGVTVRITDVTVMDGQCQGPLPAADALRSALQAAVLVDTDGDAVLLLDTQRATRIILTPTSPPGTPIPASPASPVP